MRSPAKKAGQAAAAKAGPNGRRSKAAAPAARSSPPDAGRGDASSRSARRIPAGTVFRTGHVESVFGGDTRDVIARMRTGTPARTLPGIAASLGLTQERLFEYLRLPRSTMKGRISADGKLSGVEQDRVYRVERVLARAVQVLEDDSAARAWLTRENRSLGGEAPLALLDTERGYELVLDTLGRIEYGVVS